MNNTHSPLNNSSTMSHQITQLMNTDILHEFCECHRKFTTLIIVFPIMSRGLQEWVFPAHTHVPIHIPVVVTICVKSFTIGWQELLMFFPTLVHYVIIEKSFTYKWCRIVDVHSCITLFTLWCSNWSEKEDIYPLLTRICCWHVCNVM